MKEFFFVQDLLVKFFQKKVSFNYKSKTIQLLYIDSYFCFQCRTIFKLLYLNN